MLPPSLLHDRCTWAAAALREGQGEGWQGIAIPRRLPRHASTSHRISQCQQQLHSSPPSQASQQPTFDTSEEGVYSRAAQLVWVCVQAIAGQHAAGRVGEGRRILVLIEAHVHEVGHLRKEVGGSRGSCQVGSGYFPLTCCAGPVPYSMGPSSAWDARELDWSMRAPAQQTSAGSVMP